MRDPEHHADKFLTHFYNASAEMRLAMEHMHKVIPLVNDPEVKKRYDKVHKAMASLRRQWNQLEHERERYEVKHDANV